jgi:hypothetical protein
MLVRYRRAKVFGRGKSRAMSQNEKRAIMAYADRWSDQHKLPGQHRGPLTRSMRDVLRVLLWTFHNSRDGRCFPSYERIAQAAKCKRDTVFRAIKILEHAKILTWEHRLLRVQYRDRNAFGQNVLMNRVVRTSNAYYFNDLGLSDWKPIRGNLSKSENQSGTLNQDFNNTLMGEKLIEKPLPPELKAALDRLGMAVLQKESVEIGDKV